MLSFQNAFFVYHGTFQKVQWKMHSYLYFTYHSTNLLLWVFISRDMIPEVQTSWMTLMLKSCMCIKIAHAIGHATHCVIQRNNVPEDKDKHMIGFSSAFFGIFASKSLNETLLCHTGSHIIPYSQGLLSYISDVSTQHIDISISRLGCFQLARILMLDIYRDWKQLATVYICHVAKDTI